MFISLLENLLDWVWLLVDGTDNADSDCLLHITDGETAEWWVLLEGLDDEWLGWDNLDDSGIILLNVFWVLCSLLAVATIDTLDELVELAGDVGCVAVENWLVAGVDLAWVVGDDHLSCEGSAFDWWVTLCITNDVATLDISCGNVLDVEADVVTWKSLWKGFVVHFDGLNFSCNCGWGEVNDHAWLHCAGFDTADWNCTDTVDLVDILEWKTEWLVEWALWWLKGIEGFKKVWAIVPWHVWRLLCHVVASPAGDWDEAEHFWLVADACKDACHFGCDFVETGLVVVDCLVIHLVDGDNDLLDAECEGKKCVFTCLALFSDTGFETTECGVDDKDSSISLGCACDHVLDEVTVSWGINDCEGELLAFELPEGDIDCDTTLTFSLEGVHNEGVLEGGLAELFSFLFDGSKFTLIETAALVDEVACCCGLTCIDVSDNDNIDMLFLLTHEKTKCWAMVNQPLSIIQRIWMDRWLSIFYQRPF